MGSFFVARPSSALHRSYASWSERNANRQKSNKELSAHMVAAGFKKQSTMVGKVSYGVKLKAA